MQAAAQAERDAPGGQPFAAEWDTPYGLPPFERIAPEHFRPAFDRALAEHRGEIEAIAADPAAPSFDNTVAALELSGRRLRRALCRLLQPRRRAYQRCHPGDRARDGAAARQASQRHLHEREPVPARRGPARPCRDPRRGAGARAQPLSHHLHAGRRAARPGCQEAPRRDHRAACHARHAVRPERARRREGLRARSRERGGSCRPARIPARGGGADRRGAWPWPASTSSPCRARPSSRSCNSRRAAICASRRFNAWITRGENGGATDNRPSSPRWWRCGPSAPSSSAFRQLRRISSCTTRWRRRRMRSLELLDAGLAAGAGARRSGRRRPAGARPRGRRQLRARAVGLALLRREAAAARARFRRGADQAVSAARQDDRGGLLHREPPVRLALPRAARRARLPSRRARLGGARTRTAVMSACSSATISPAPRSAAAPG